MNYLTLAETHEALLSTFSVFHEMCTAHGIRYSMDAGTLLGAVRHRGFIPWDDDIDVLIPRPDFERLRKNPCWCPSGYRMGPYMNGADGFEIPIIKFCNMSYRAQEPALDGILEEYLWIDVFPADAVPDDDSQAMDVLNEQVRLTKCADRRVFNIDATTSNPVKRLAKKTLRPLLLRTNPPQQIYWRMIENATHLEFGSTERIANISWFVTIGPRWIPSNAFENLIDLPFEGHLFKAVACWDECLSNYYGNDYMIPLPPGKRRAHSINTWRA